MHSETEVEKRLRQVVWKYLKLRISKEASKKVENCRHALFRGLKDGETTVFCRYACKEGEQPREICPYVQDTHDCPVYAQRKTVDQIKLEFQNDLKRALYKRHNMKDLVQLEWVLGLSEQEAGDLESKFLDEFLEYQEKQRLRSRRWYSLFYRWILSFGSGAVKPVSQESSPL